MIQQKVFKTLFVGILVSVIMAGCGERYVKGTQIKFSPEKQEIADLVEQYRLAVEQRDVDALRTMASLKYYENASTTTDPTDDYDYNGLEKVLAELKNTVKTVKYSVKIKEIDIIGEAARVDYEYESQYLLALGDQDRWATRTDKNRLLFTREDGEWKIRSGM